MSESRYSPIAGRSWSDRVLDYLSAGIVDGSIPRSFWFTVFFTSMQQACGWRLAIAGYAALWILSPRRA